MTGRIINLDPGVNLQLRQYPSRQALSLGLAPGGTDLEVVGREGAPVALVEGDPAPPEAEDFVDPAEDLGEDEDLNPEETWLRVIYPTPDGGTISAWVLAQYVEVRDAEGDLVALKDIETFGGNVPGEAINTAITPPSEAEDRVTVVVTNLNAGVNLNIRRTPVTTSEVLTRLSNNTVMDFVGLIDPADDPNGDWVFIEYQSPQGGIVTGWASTLYVRYEYNGRDTDLVELDERELLAFVDADRIGEVRGSAPSVAIPTPDPQRDAYVATVQLDPGANLQFRSAPNAQAESLNLIPSGTSLIITGRTADAEWLSTTFEGQQGWISAQFVSLTFNGQDVPLEDVPVDPDAPGAAG